jgi:hypothetical protein
MALAAQAWLLYGVGGNFSAGGVLSIWLVIVEVDLIDLGIMEFWN